MPYDLQLKMIKISGTQKLGLLDLIVGVSMLDPAPCLPALKKLENDEQTQVLGKSWNDL